MRVKQTICMIIVGAALILAAGLIETQPVISFGLLAIMGAAAYIGRLDKRRVTCADVERRWNHAEN